MHSEQRSDAHRGSAGPGFSAGGGAPGAEFGAVVRSSRPRHWRLLTLLLFSLAAFPGCGPSGVTLLKPSNLVDYQYVTCFPHKDDPGALNACIRYYQDRGFVRQDRVNELQM